MLLRVNRELGKHWETSSFVVPTNRRRSFHDSMWFYLAILLLDLSEEEGGGEKERYPLFVLNLPFLCPYNQSSFELNVTVTFVIPVYIVILIVGSIDKLYVSIN